VLLTVAADLVRRLLLCQQRQLSFNHRGRFRPDSDTGEEGDGVGEVVAAVVVQLDLMSGHKPGRELCAWPAGTGI
jgi:hypothetical protein